MDKFPEAFDRFEEQVDVSRTRSFDELLTQFEIWAGQRWKETPQQLQALKIEARRLGIVPPPRYPQRTYSHLHRTYPSRTYPHRTYSHQVITRRGRQMIVYRDPRSGRFVKR